MSKDIEQKTGKLSLWDVRLSKLKKNTVSGSETVS